MKASDRTSSRTARPGGPDEKNGSSSSSTGKRFTLAGPSLQLDPRIHAYRKDIADIALAGRLIAPHYARPMIRRIGTEAARLVAAPSDTEIVAELEPGEEFALLDVTGDWAWGYRRKDHVVGYLPASALEAI